MKLSSPKAILSFLFILKTLTLSGQIPGTLDTSFNSLGTGTNGYVYAICLQPDGKIIIGGQFSIYNTVTRNCIARLNADGSLDYTFNPGSGAGNNIIYAIALQADGKIIIGGNFSIYNGTPCYRITRINSDGSLDTSFSAGTGPSGYVKSIAIQPDGKIIIAGSFGGYNGVLGYNIARLNSNGSIDPTFNIGNGFYDQNSGGSDVVNSIDLQNDGKIVCGGDFHMFNGNIRHYLVRINPDGSLDNSINAGSFPGEQLHVVKAQPDGRILIGGDFTHYTWNFGFAYKNHLLRLSNVATPDQTFDIGSGPTDRVISISLQPDGKVIAGGQFTSFDGNYVVRIIQLNTDGSPSVTYNTGSGFSDNILTTAIQPDGKIIAGGKFSQFGGINVNHIARLNAFDLLTDQKQKLIQSTTLYPNPTDGKLNFDPTNFSIQSISIQNLIGATMMQFPAMNIMNNSIDVSSLANGIYFVTIEADNQFSTIKFIKK